MDAAYWRNRWEQGHTGWHRDDVLPYLREQWAGIEAPTDARVLVPLCGKSLDMPWLALQGHRVLGIELAQAGIEAYLEEQGFHTEVQDTAAGALYRAGPVQLLHADIFDVPAEVLGTCSAIHDRAALIALPQDMRRRYVEHVYGALPAGSVGLLVTLEFDQQRKPGPPFSVDREEVRALLQPAWDVTLIQRRDILRDEPSFLEAGVTGLHTAVYGLRKR